MNTVTIIIDWLIYIPLACCVGYLLLYAIASKFYHIPQYPEAKKQHRFLVLFPAYKEDRVILDSIKSFLKQNYPKELFDIIVISDHMKPETNETLRQLPIKVLIATYKDSSKAKAMALAIDETKNTQYDMVVIMDADNVTTSNFLQVSNQAYSSGALAIQAHRTGKNLNTDIALLDAVSEEINNGFFRSGHNALGLSAGLAGSGMVFDMKWFRKNVRALQTAGEDKELEALLLRERIHIVYLEQIPIYDEKTQKKEAIKNQRKRWIAAQFGALRHSLPYFPKALLHGNFDYCDKILQWMLPPRLIQLAAVFLFTIIVTLVSIFINSPYIAIKWWILSIAQILAMLIPVPSKLVNTQLLKAVLKVPILAIIMIGNLFKLKGVNQKFIHTEHGK